MLNFLTANNIMDMAGLDEKFSSMIGEQQDIADKLTDEQKTLNGRYFALKDEVREADQIRRSVYSILRQEQREQQPRGAHDMVL